MNKQIAVVTLLAAIAVIASAYDFNDPVFNQILADELENLHESYDSYSHPRSRRDEDAVNEDKCRWQRKKKLCCGEATFEEHHDKEKDLKRQCFKDVVDKNNDSKDNRDARGEFDPFRCDKVEKHKKEMTCVFKCVGEKKGVLDSEGNPKEAEFAAQVKENMKNENWFASVQDKVIETCLAEAKNATTNRDASDSTSCNPAGVKLWHCMFREIQLGCPADQIKDEKACARVRDKIKRHGDYFHGSSPVQDE